MAEQPVSRVPTTPPLGHLAVRLDERRPVLQPFMFERQEKRIGPALGISLFTHIAVGVIVLLVAAYGPERVFPTDDQPSLIKDIVWLNQPGPGGGGGGGGNQMKAPPQRAELPGKEKISVPVQKVPEVRPLDPPKAEPMPKPETPPLDIPAMTMGATNQTLPGVIEGGLADSLSRGPGSGTGAGTGRGSGIGSGTGSGLGDGWGGGTGGGVYRPGSGIETPVVLREVKPQYTSDAMRAKIQGVVVLNCIILPDGTVGQVEVVKSLDSVFGLDQEAVKAAKQWRFIPGKKQGQPVPVLVSIELTFTLR
jgi:TonB family protein